jgi:FKBP-type peptidyl-prolyl cis-trans isomerase FkpA
MKKVLAPMMFLLLATTACNETKTEEKIELNSAADRLAYALGADHARSISESGDPYFSRYSVDQIVEGFEIGLKDEKAFDDACKTTMNGLFGPTGQDFDTTYLKAGSLCLGKLSGMVFQTSWMKKGAMDKIDFKNVIIGFKHGLTGADTVLDRTEQSQIIQDFFEDLNKINGTKMLDIAKKQSNSQVTSSGIILETIELGKGGKPAAGDDVLAHYILMNSMGDTLQSSFEMVEKFNQPLNPFSLAAVVPGWQEGMPMMNKGGKYKLYLPYNLAYGERGMFNQQTNSYDIQPYEALVFYIELIDYGKPGSLSK